MSFMPNCLARDLAEDTDPSSPIEKRLVLPPPVLYAGRRFLLYSISGY